LRAKPGRSIREARRAAGLTQEHLGRRLGLKGRAIYRWERDEAAPTARHRRALVQEIQAVNPEAAAKLRAALDARPADAKQGNIPQAPAPPPARSAAEVLELAVLRMADELDLAARRVRRPLGRLLERLRASDVSLEAAQKELELWIAQAE
jgi:transcriptional regulator with XRE-family HTH domain